MSRQQVQHDKVKAHAAVAAYIARYGPDVPIADLRGFGGPTLAAFLKSHGYVREGERKIETCPGKTVFYVKAPAA